MGTRHQRGYIFRKGGFWYVRFYDNVAHPGGSIVRGQVCRQVAPYCDRYRSKRDVKPLVEEMLKPVNAGGLLPESVLPVEQFIEIHYLPYVGQRWRPSTAKGYRDIWHYHIRGRASEIRLRDFRPVDGERLLQQIAKESDYHLSRTTLKHIKSFLSGVFTYARRQGALNGANPIQGVSIPQGLDAEDTHAYTLEEVTQMLAAVPEKARAVIGVAAFTGLRRSEIRGLRWEDYRAACEGQWGEIRVERSVWRSHVQPTKTKKSKAPVLVIPVLAKILDEYHRSLGSPSDGFIFEGVRNRAPLDLDSFAHHFIEPFLAAKKLKWQWWHPFRRGLATNLHRLGVADKVIQAILRHSSLDVTMSAYVKDVPVASIEAMQRLEHAICNQYATSGGGLIS